jgi:hypothetical protein
MKHSHSQQTPPTTTTTRALRARVPRFRGALVAATLVTGVVCAAVVGGAVAVQPAVAAEVANAITGETLAKTEFDAWERVQLDFTWAVPDSAQAGDTFQLVLPAELTLPSTASFSLLSPSGEVVATAVWNGKIATFTLTDYVNNRTDVNGSGYFMIEWDLGETGTQPGTFDLTLGGKVVTVTFPGTGEPGPETKPDPNPYKFGGWERSDQGVDAPDSALGWAIRLPENDEVGVPGPITITDIVGPGQAIDCDSIYASSAMDWHSSAEWTEFPSSRFTVVSCSASTFTVTLDQLNPGEWAYLEYTSSITDSTLGTFTNSADISNTATTTPVGSGLKRDEAGGNGQGIVPTTTAPPTAPATTTPPTTPASTPPATTAAATGAPAVAGKPTVGTLANTGDNPVGLIALAGGILIVGASAAVIAARLRPTSRGNSHS